MLLRAHHALSDGQGFVRGLLDHVASLDQGVDKSKMQYNAGRNTTKALKQSLFQNLFVFLMKVLFFIYGTFLATTNCLKFVFSSRKSMARNDKTWRKQGESLLIRSHFPSCLVN